jgi:hypothetical protein
MTINSAAKRLKLEPQFDSPLEQLPALFWSGLLNKLNFSDLSSIEQVSKKTQKYAQQHFMLLAERYGYGVDDPQIAKWCLNQLLDQIDLLHQKNQLPFNEPKRLQRFYALHRLSKASIFQFLSQTKHLYEDTNGNVLKIFELESSWHNATDTPEDLNVSAIAVNNAVCFKKIPLLKVLLQQKASLGPFKESDKWGSPLHRAVETCSLVAIPLLLMHNADIDLSCQMGTSLHVAFNDVKHCQFSEVVELLLQSKANPNAREPEWLPPLSLAARAGLPHIVKLLLEHKADVHATSSTGLTALHFALGAHPDLHDRGYVLYKESSEVISLLQQLN